MQVHLRSASGKDANFVTAGLDSIGDLKARAVEALISHSTPVGLGDLCLSLEGCILSDDDALASCAIADGCQVVLLRKPGKQCGLFVKPQVRMAALVPVCQLLGHLVNHITGIPPWAPVACYIYSSSSFFCCFVTVQAAKSDRATAGSGAGASSAGGSSASSLASVPSGVPIARALCLTDVDITGDIVEHDASIVIRQTFVNTTGAAVTADYCFPLSAGAAVYRVEALVTDAPGAGPRIIRSHVREKEWALREHAKALAAGRTAVFMEQAAGIEEEDLDADSAVKEEVYRMGVGNVPAGARVVVTIAFLAELTPIAESSSPGTRAARLVLPRHLLHRYVPTHCIFGDDAAALSAWSAGGCAGSASAGAPAGTSPPLSMHLGVRTAAALAAITCSSHSMGVGAVEDAVTSGGGQTGRFTLQMPASQWIDDLHADSHKDVHIVVATAAMPPSATVGAGAGSAAAATPSVAIALEEVVLPSPPAGVAADAAAGASSSSSAHSASYLGSVSSAAVSTSDVSALDDASCMTVAITVTPELAQAVLAANYEPAAIAGAGAAAVPGAHASHGQPQEFFFVLDRCDGLDAAGFEHLRRALQLALRCLPRNSRFAIVRSRGDEIEVVEASALSAAAASSSSAMATDAAASAAASGSSSSGGTSAVAAEAHAAAAAADGLHDADGNFTSRLLPLTDAALAAATADIDSIDDWDGTDLLAQLLPALTAKAAGTSRHVFVFTDGNVTNGSEVLAIARAAVDASGGSLRIHALGMGSVVDVGLIEGLAAAGAGAAVFITEDEPFEEELTRVVQTAVNLTSLTVTADWACAPAAWANSSDAAGGAGAVAVADDHGSSIASTASLVPGLPYSAQLHADPVRLFAVLQKPTGPGSTAAALRDATLTFRESGGRGRVATVKLHALPAVLSVIRTAAAAIDAPQAVSAVKLDDDYSTAAAAVVTTGLAIPAVGESSRAISAGPLAVRAVQAAMRELQLVEDCYLLQCGYSVDDGASIYSGPLLGQLPPRWASDFCCKHAVALSVRWGLLGCHTAFVGEVEEQAEREERERRARQEAERDAAYEAARKVAKEDAWAKWLENPHAVPGKLMVSRRAAFWLASATDDCNALSLATFYITLLAACRLLPTSCCRPPCSKSSSRH